MLGCKGFVFDGSFDTDYTLLTINQIHFWENELHRPLTLSSKERFLACVYKEPLPGLRIESSNGQSQWFKVWLCIRSSNESTPAPYRWYKVGIAYNLNAIINVLVMVTFTCTSRFKSSRSVRDLGDAKFTCAIANFEFFEEKFIIVIYV